LSDVDVLVLGAGPVGLTLAPVSASVRSQSGSVTARNALTTLSPHQIAPTLHRRSFVTLAFQCLLRQNVAVYPPCAEGPARAARTTVLTPSTMWPI